MVQSTPQQPLTLSPVGAWIDGELVQLPSGRVMRLRQLDPLSVISPEDNGVPNFLLPMIMGTKSPKSEESTDKETIVQLAPLLNRVAEQSVVEPAIVDEAAMKRGEGITLNLIPVQDKMAILTYSMGGTGAVQSATRFLQKQADPVADVQPEKQHITE